MYDKLTQKLVNKVFKGVKTYLKEKGYSEPVWSSEFCDWLLVYDYSEDKPIARLTKVVYNAYRNDEDTPPTRKEFEDIMVSLAMEGVFDFKCSITCDCIYLKVLGDNKALFKHHFNCLD